MKVHHFHLQLRNDRNAFFITMSSYFLCIKRKCLYLEVYALPFFMDNQCPFSIFKWVFHNIYYIHVLPPINNDVNKQQPQQKWLDCKKFLCVFFFLLISNVYSMICMYVSNVNSSFDDQFFLKLFKGLFLKKAGSGLNGLAASHCRLAGVWNGVWINATHAESINRRVWRILKRRTRNNMSWHDRAVVNWMRYDGDDVCGQIFLLDCCSSHFKACQVKTGRADCGIWLCTGISENFLVIRVALKPI